MEVTTLAVKSLPVHTQRTQSGGSAVPPPGHDLVLHTGKCEHSLKIVELHETPSIYCIVNCGF